VARMMSTFTQQRRVWRGMRVAIYLMIALLPLLAAQPAAAQGGGPIYTAEVEGVISRYAVGYLRRALREAEAAQASALIIRVGSEGAVLRDVRGLAADLAAATVPVVVYVAPGGTDAGAAGAWLLSAAHLAAMAPDTSFGAATPLAEPTADVSNQVRELFLAEVTRQLGGWNRERGRSDAWVERAAREGAVLTNEQAAALDPPAVEIVARDEQDLLISIEGRAVTLQDGSQIVLRSLGQGVTPLGPSLMERLLLLLAEPTLAFLLLVMAGIAIYAEFATPTVGVLAGIGVVLLIGSLVGLFALPVRWLSILGLLLAFGLVAADLFTPSHGALTVVGLIMMVVSALFLYDAAQAPGVSVALWAITLVALLIAGFAALGIFLVVRTRNQPVTTGAEGLVGRLAEVRRRLEPEGMVFVEGALWRAVCENGEAEVGEYVRVTAIYELRLTVRRADEGSP
jgi:membrane-bound serine protease (ClpP class)